MAIEAHKIRELAQGLGIDAIGWADAAQIPVDITMLQHRIAQMPPELGYVGRRIQERLNPSLILPGVKTVVMCAISYFGNESGIEDMPDGAGFISRFAWSRDYHLTVLPKIQALAREIEVHFGAKTKSYVDTGPILEKAWAAACGLGFIGKNGLLITPQFGSFVFLGSILVDLEVDHPALPAVPSGCTNCVACQEACPTGALATPWCIDYERCLAHQTVTAKQKPPADLPLAGHLYGCDRCQDVCPFNRRLKNREYRQEFQPLPGLKYPELRTILSMDEQQFKDTFKDTPVIRRGREKVQMIARRLVEP